MKPRKVSRPELAVDYKMSNPGPLAWQRIVAWRDGLISHKPSTGALLENFDGVRAVAALMVFFQHIAGMPYLVLGPAGVWLFFTLSGYLLYLVFLRQGSLLPGSDALIAYLTRRTFRIVPLFVVVLVVMGFLWVPPKDTLAYAWVNQHLLGLMGEHHLWTIKVELLFYLFLPLLILLLAPFNNTITRVGALLVTACLVWWFFEHKMVLVLNGGMPYFTPFILGMLAVHIQPHINRKTARIITLVGVLGILGFGIDNEFAAGYRHAIGFTEWQAMWSMGHYVYPFCLLLILGVASHKSAFWGNPWLRLVGVVGYGFYLWHPLVIVFIKDLLGAPLIIHMLLCFLITMLLSITSYRLIEKPGINLGRALAKFIASGSVRTIFKRFVLRPVYPVFLLAGLFVLLRLDYGFKPEITIQADVYAEQPALTQFFVTDDKAFKEEWSAYHRIDADQWYTLDFTVPEMRLARLRFDPGNVPGNYRLKNLKILYPFADKPVNLNLGNMFQHHGVMTVSLADNMLLIETEPNQYDAILRYAGDLGQPVLRPWSWRLGIVILVFLGLTVFAIGLDRLSSRFAGRLGADKLLFN